MIRSMTGLTSAVPWPTVSVSMSRALIARALSCSSGKLASIRLQRRSFGSLTTVSMRSATPSFRLSGVVPVYAKPDQNVCGVDM